MGQTKPEKEIKHLEDRELLNYIYTCIDRSQTEAIGALKNIYYAKYAKDEEELMEKLISGQGYVIDEIEHLTHMRHALKELHRRWLRTKRAKFKMEQNLKKFRKERVVYEEVMMPDLWNMGTIVEEDKADE